MRMTEAMAIPKLEKDGLDLEIRDIIIQLNASGFITSGSCAGHRDCPPGHGNRGFISFATIHTFVAVKAVLTWYGLKNITIYNHQDIDEGNWTSATFGPIGFPISDWWISQAAFCEEKGITKKGADKGHS